MNRTLIVCVTLVLAHVAISAQGETNLQITAVEDGGVITWSNVNPSLYYRIEWADTLVNSNSWKVDYTPLIDVHSTESEISVGIPRFFRVVGGDQILVPDVVNVRAGTIVQGVAGTFWEGNRFDLAAGGETIVDYKLGLMWTRSLDWNRSDWTGAVAFCDSLNHGGFSDWRLPTRDELEGIIGTGSFPDDNLLGDKPAFSDVTADYYWTSTDGGNPDNAWRVRYGADSTHFDSKNALNLVWPVRDN